MMLCPTSRWQLSSWTYTKQTVKQEIHSISKEAALFKNELNAPETISTPLPKMKKIAKYKNQKRLQKTWKDKVMDKCEGIT